MRATLIHARERVYVLYRQIGKVVHELHGEVLAVLDELPFAYRVGEVRYLFHAEVGEAAHYLHSEVGEVLDDLDAAAELYAVAVSVGRDVPGEGAGRGERRRAENRRRNREYFPHFS